MNYKCTKKMPRNVIKTLMEYPLTYPVKKKSNKHINN